jgi:isocitrate dehydrogenase
MKAPQKVDMVVFRENTEDVYAGFEWKAGSSEANQVIEFLNTQLGCKIREASGVGIKPMSKFGSQRLIRMAIQYALRHRRPHVTLMHKGNIMKFTEGAFREWGYQLAKDEFSAQVMSEDEIFEKYQGKTPDNKMMLKDRIADSMFQQVLLRPDEYSVIATPNLNGDYISDALTAQVGGLGISPGANIGDRAAVFEATHGTAPKYANQDKVNPSSVILSGVMMFEHLQWQEAADAITTALQKAITQKTVTYDFARQMEGAKEVRCSEFASRIIDNL